LAGLIPFIGAGQLSLFFPGINIINTMSRKDECQETGKEIREILPAYAAAGASGYLHTPVCD